MVSCNSDDILKTATSQKLYGQVCEILKENQEPNDVAAHHLGSKAMFKYLCVCFETPRPSGHLEQITKRLFEIGEKLQVSVEKDDVGNVLLKKKSLSDGMDTLCIQAHLDIVASKESSIDHDFETEPIKTRLVEDAGDMWIQGTGTTLGADNGIGVAAGLALLEDTDPNMPNLEILLTVEEESDMSGAEKLRQSPFLSSKILINVDSEEENAVCVGCAGGFEKVFTQTIGDDAIEKASPSSKDVVEIEIKGLTGGHSGIDIHRNRSNAIVVLLECIQLLKSSEFPSLQLKSIKGGSAVNTIPRESSGVISIDRSNSGEAHNLTTIKSRIDEFLKAKVIDIDTEAHCTVQKWDGPGMFFTGKETSRLIAQALELPHGVLKMDTSIDAVETSVNLSRIEMDTNSNKSGSNFMAHLFWRSSIDAELGVESKKAETLAQKHKMTISKDIAWFPGWQPNVTASPSLTAVIDCHKDLFKKEPRVYSVHAGLETGFIKKNYPNMDCVSIGPLIEGAHTPGERLNVLSAHRFYKLLHSTCCKLGKLK